MLKKTFKAPLQYSFSAVILLKFFFYLQLNIIVKIDPKTCTFEKLE